MYFRRTSSGTYIWIAAVNVLRVFDCQPTPLLPLRRGPKGGGAVAEVTVILGMWEGGRTGLITTEDEVVDVALGL
jgi:hypothetical protein